MTRFLATLLFCLQAVVCHGQTSIQNLPAAQALSPADLFIVDQLISPSVRRTGQTPLSSIFSSFLGTPQSFIGNNTAPITAYGAQVTVQNSATNAQQIYQGTAGSQVFYGALRSAIVVPSGSTVTNSSAVDTYVQCNAVFIPGTPAAGACVGDFGIQILTTDGAKAWGVNSACNDTTNNASAATSNRTCIGYEFDCTIATNNAGSACQGVSVIINGLNGAQAGGNGFQASIKSGSLARWTDAFVSDDGAATVALLVGAALVSGTSINSQVVAFQRFDSGGVEHSENLFDDSTGALNWNGSGLAAKTAALTAGTLANAQSVLSLAATQPSSPVAAQNAVSVTVTSAGSATQPNRAMLVSYNAGYTGSSNTQAITGNNTAAGTGATIIPAANSNTFGGNAGFSGNASGTTTGFNIGAAGITGSGNTNVGVLGLSQVNKNSATNIGVVGSAINGGASPIFIGGWFSLNQTTVPTVSAALIADNGSQSAPVFLGAVNGTTKVSIDQSGVFGITAATWADNQTCTTGQISVDTGFIYVCTAANTVKRAALSTF